MLHVEKTLCGSHFCTVYTSINAFEGAQSDVRICINRLSYNAADMILGTFRWIGLVYLVAREKLIRF